MEYIKKTNDLSEILTEDLIDANSFDEFVLGDYSKAFYLGWTLISATQYDILTREFKLDIQKRLEKEVSTELGIEIPKLLNEYSECFNKDNINSIDASNYVLTILEKDEYTKDKLLISAFAIGFTLGK